MSLEPRDEPEGEQVQKRKRLKRDDSAAVEALLGLNGSSGEVSFSSLGFDGGNQNISDEENFTSENHTIAQGLSLDEDIINNSAPIRSTRKVIENESGEVVTIKGAWSHEEDQIMLNGIKRFGMDWKKVAKGVTGRSAKQCRDRYRLKLDPSINHGPWTNEEDELLLKLHDQIGRHWTKIAKLLPGRTENAVKSRYSSLFRSRSKEWRNEEEQLLESLHSQGVSFDDISKHHLPHRSEHAIKKRWEKLHMRKIASQIKQHMPTLGSPGYNAATGESEELPKLNPALAASTQSSVSRPAETNPNSSSIRNNTFVPINNSSTSQAHHTLNNFTSAGSLGSLNMNSLNSFMALNGNMPNIGVGMNNFSEAVNYFNQQPGLGSNLGGLNLNAFASTLSQGNRGGKLNRTFTAGTNISTFSALSTNSMPQTDIQDGSEESKEDNMNNVIAPMNSEEGAERKKMVNFKEQKTMNEQSESQNESKENADSEAVKNKNLQRVKSRAGRLKRYSTSTTVMMGIIGEPLKLSLAQQTDGTGVKARGSII